MAVIGWKLDPDERVDLLERFAPSYAHVVADHVTLASDVPDDADLPSATRGGIVGAISDGRGVQALVVAIEGDTRRPDGSTYHITWSLGPGRRAVESNAVIAEMGWHPLRDRVPIALSPAFL